MSEMGSCAAGTCQTVRRYEIERCRTVWQHGPNPEAALILTDLEASRFPRDFGESVERMTKHIVDAWIAQLHAYELQRAERTTD